MRCNPIWVKELKTRARVVKIPILLMFYNAVVALIAVFMLFTSVDIFNGGLYTDYAGMTTMFAGLGVLQCGVGFLVTLVLTSNSISGEKEQGTLDLMLVTSASPGTVIGGKLMSAISTSTLFAVSSFPVLAVGTIYGGVNVDDMIYLGIVFFLLSVYAGSAGILCSTLMERSNLSMLTSLVLEVGLIVGPFLILEAIHGILYSRIQGTMDPTVSLGGWVLILLVNPLMPILDFCDRIFGKSFIMDLFFFQYGIGEETALSYFLQRYFGQCCIVVQMLLSLLFLWISMKKLRGSKKRRKKETAKEYKDSPKRLFCDIMNTVEVCAYVRQQKENRRIGISVEMLSYQGG